MKTKILLLAVFVFANLISNNSNGQLIIPGFKAGMNISKFKSPQFSSTSRKGLDVGIIFLARFSENLGLITEFTYSQKGGNARGRDFNVSLIDYVDYKMYFGSGSWSLIGNYYLKAPNFGVQFGPAFGLVHVIPARQLADPEYFFGDALSSDSLISSMKFYDNLHMKFDYSLAFGICGGSETFKVSLRYYMGLRNYYKNEDTENVGLKMKNNYIQLTLSYMLMNFRVIS